MPYRSIIQDVKNKKFKPVYLLHGEESYYIDLISKEIQEQALEEHERDFNQTVLYGKDTDVLTIVSEAKGYPMMSERRLVVIREAQDLKNIDDLESYCSQPNPTTVLVLAYKYKKFDSRKKLLKEITKHGQVFLSDKVRDYQLVDWITNYLKTTEYSITPKAATLLADFLGNDLSKITNELDKLALLLQKGTTINEVHIEENIGISKDYNVFELINAISVRDVQKAMKIVHYFEHNPKSANIVQVVSMVFQLFSRLMRIHFLNNKSNDAVAQALKVHPFATRDLIKATTIYPPKKISSNISILHEYDLKSKGVNNSSFTEGDLMRELIFKLMH
jgi:DNA polymerase-3 subunit delta